MSYGYVHARYALLPRLYPFPLCYDHGFAATPPVESLSMAATLTVALHAALLAVARAADDPKQNERALRALFLLERHFLPASHILSPRRRSHRRTLMYVAQHWILPAAWRCRRQRSAMGIAPARKKHAPLPSLWGRRCPRCVALQHRSLLAKRARLV